MSEFHSAEQLRPNTSSLTHIPIDDLKIPRRQLRRHAKSQIRKIARSLDTFGFVSPVLIDRHNNVIAGVARIQAAKELGLTTALALRVEHLSDEEIRLYRIADNRLAEEAEWNLPDLQQEFGDLITLELDITITGFETPQIDMVLVPPGTDADPADDIQALNPDREPVTRTGDTWAIGPHRLHCGDARDTLAYTALLGEDQVKAVFTDPPYNVPVAGHMGGLGRHKHREFLMASGEMPPEAFSALLRSGLENAATHAAKGAVLFVCMDWRSIDVLKRAADAAGLETLNLCVWNKTNGAMGSLYRSKHELVWVFRIPGAGHTNNVQLGKHGRNRTNVWDYAGANTPGSDSHRDLALHPTIKPIALIADAILDVTNRNDIVLDMFGGVGSTLLAAERTGRIARLIELDPLYVDATLDRVRENTGLEPRLVATGQTFEQVRTERNETEHRPPARFRPRAERPMSDGGADEC
nr:DNA methyltransferase [uncultured Hyphomonas sp.]